MGGSQRAGLGNSIPIFKVSQGTCPLAHVFRAFQRGGFEPRVNRASPGALPASPLFIRGLEAPARKRPIYTGFRAPDLKSLFARVSEHLPDRGRIGKTRGWKRRCISKKR